MMEHRCDLEGCARIVDGRLVVESGGRPVPLFLLKANAAVCAGSLTEAGMILSPENLRIVVAVLDQDRSRVDLIYMVVKLLLAVGSHDVAEAWCLRLAEADPGPLAWYYLALATQQMPGRSKQALIYAERAFHDRPETPLYAEVYASCLAACGQMDAALDVMGQLFRTGGASVDFWEGFLGDLLYLPATTRSHLSVGYGLLGQEISRKIGPCWDHSNDPDPGRRLRVGFLSPDFRRNSTAIPFEMFLDGADRSRVEIYAYGNVKDPDFVTERIRGKVDHYEDILGWPADQAAARVRAHEIDVLVALGGYVQGHCLKVMAFKPAPVQVDYGWVTTTGIRQIDYRFSDAVLDVPQELGLYGEKTVYLSGGYFGYVPPQNTPLVGPLPARRNGVVTFGSFNRRVKMNEDMIGLWSRILKQTTGSHLIVKSPSDDPALLRRLVLPRMESLGIEADRIEFYGPQSYLDYLDLFNRIDLGLDTFPFNGAITTMEGLWMGVPVVTLAGEKMTSRAGQSILSRLGLEIFAAPSPEEYVAKAVAFASQLDALEQIRRALRSWMLKSPLCDPGRWALEMEQGFRQMWRRWCDRQIKNQKSKINNKEEGR
jgi:protein O-GlcNAc transferase